jgi:hypothetical protein
MLAAAVLGVVRVEAGTEAWNKRLEAELTAHAFVQINADPSVWIFYCEGVAVLTMLYVDDGMGAARTNEKAATRVLLVSLLEIR